MRQKGTELVIPSYHSFDFGPFALIKKSFGKIDFAAGIRYDLRDFQNDSMFTEPNPVTGFDQVVPPSAAESGVVKQFDYYKHTFAGGSGSVGATYNFSDRVGIKANFARGYRAPNAAEISAKGVHPGTGFEQLGDINFKPEFSLQEDAGAFWNTEIFSASIDLFNTNISNYIYDEKLQSVNGGDSIFMQDGNSYPVFKFRQTTAQLYGGEFSFDIHPLSWLHFENTISYIDGINKGGNGAVITDSTRYLPLIPPSAYEFGIACKQKWKAGLFNCFLHSIWSGILCSAKSFLFSIRHRNIHAFLCFAKCRNRRECGKSKRKNDILLQHFSE